MARWSAHFVALFLTCRFLSLWAEKQGKAGWEAGGMREGKVGGGETCQQQPTAPEGIAVSYARPPLIPPDCLRSSPPLCGTLCQRRPMRALPAAFIRQGSTVSHPTRLSAVHRTLLHELAQTPRQATPLRCAHTSRPHLELYSNLFLYFLFYSFLLFSILTWFCFILFYSFLILEDSYILIYTAFEGNQQKSTIFLNLKIVFEFDFAFEFD